MTAGVSGDAREDGWCRILTGGDFGGVVCQQPRRRTSVGFGCSDTFLLGLKHRRDCVMLHRGSVFPQSITKVTGVASEANNAQLLTLGDFSAAIFIVNYIIFQAKWPNMFLFCEDLLLFFVIFDGKLNICNVFYCRMKKTSCRCTFGLLDYFLSFYRWFIQKIITRLIENENNRLLICIFVW